MTRFGSITPTTVNGFIPISADHSHVAEEARESSVAKLSLLTRKQDIGLSTAQMEAAAQNVVDQSQIGQASAVCKAVEAVVDGMLDRLTKYEALVSQYEKFIATYPGLELCCIVDYTNSHSAVRRFGIDVDCLVGNAIQDLSIISVPTVSGGSVKSGSKASSGVKLKDFAHLLHPLEVHQIREAIKHVNSNNKTALVDIFESLEDGRINIGSDGKPGIHTVLLSQQIVKATTQILVIDPSNSEFSRHLMFNKEIICGVGIPVEILASPVMIKIYAAPSKASVGPASDQYRDCTDIAVKLAFGLNKYLGLSIDMSKLAQLPFVQEVTNIPEIHKLLFLDQSHSLRARQSSIDDHRVKIHKILSSTKTQADLALQYKSEVEELQLYNEMEAILYKPSLPSDYSAHIVALSGCHEQHADFIAQMMKDFIA
jgi:hypothetical protein